MRRRLPVSFEASKFPLHSIKYQDKQKLLEKLEDNRQNDQRVTRRSHGLLVFTPQTTPDRELLELLHPSRHEVVLHVANHPYPEWERLEKATKRKVKYYTVHGTARLVARLMWRRKRWEAKAPISAGFPLKSFHDFSTLGLTACATTTPRRKL